MRTVTDLLHTKGSAVWSIGPAATVYEALEQMDAKDVGALLVLDQGEVVGIFSERDYARKVVLQGRTSRETPVGDVMTRRVVYVRPDQSLDDCMALMTSKRIRHLPVMDAGQLAGLISIGDVVKSIISDQEFMIEQLEKYITGQR